MGPRQPCAALSCIENRAVYMQTITPKKQKLYDKYKQRIIRFQDIKR